MRVMTRVRSMIGRQPFLDLPARRSHLCRAFVQSLFRFGGIETGLWIPARVVPAIGLRADIVPVRRGSTGPGGYSRSSAPASSPHAPTGRAFARPVPLPVISRQPGKDFCFTMFLISPSQHGATCWRGVKKISLRSPALPSRPLTRTCGAASDQLPDLTRSRCIPGLAIIHPRGATIAHDAGHHHAP
jgi:hypothetical protein